MKTRFIFTHKSYSDVEINLTEVKTFKSNLVESSLKAFFDIKDTFLKLFFLKFCLGQFLLREKKPKISLVKHCHASR